MADTEGDIRRFAGDIPKMAELLNKRISDVVKHTALAVVAKIIPAHPVDTGYSRANWRIAADTPDVTVSTPPDKGAGKGSYPDRTPSGNDVKEGATTVFVTNSVHYVRWLEEGTSYHGGLHFIKRAAQEVGTEMNDFIAKSKAENPPIT
jgi:hypothetical protein